MPLLPNRRWLRFSVRTLLVAVTICGCWMSYSANWIRQRNAALTEVASNGVLPYYEPLDNSGISVSPPALLGLFGEQGYSLVSLACWEVEPGKISGPDQAEVQRLASLFPEAKVEAFLCGLISRPSKDE